MKMSPFPSPWVILAGIAVGLPAAAGAQAEVTMRWAVRAEAHVDLWYAALSQVGYEGIGPLPLYAAGYAAELRGAKREGGVTTDLDRGARGFREAFDADSAFEILHFVPIYFLASGRAEMLDALRAVAAGRGAATVPGPGARFGASAVEAVLTSPEQRTVLAAFVDAVDDEWQAFYGAYWREGAQARGRSAEAVQSLWSDRLAEPLGPFLRHRHLDGGVILVSPAVGPEGRIFQGRPDDRTDNTVAVRLPADTSGPTVAVLSVVRELCFPVVSGLVQQLGPPDRLTGERLSVHAGVRCGAELLVGTAAGLTAAYRRAFAGGTGATFTERFPVDAGLLDAIRRALNP